LCNIQAEILRTIQVYETRLDDYRHSSHGSDAITTEAIKQDLQTLMGSLGVLHAKAQEALGKVSQQVPPDDVPLLTVGAWDTCFGVDLSSDSRQYFTNFFSFHLENYRHAEQHLGQMLSQCLNLLRNEVQLQVEGAAQSEAEWPQGGKDDVLLQVANVFVAKSTGLGDVSIKHHASTAQQPAAVTISYPDSERYDKQGYFDRLVSTMSSGAKLIPYDLTDQANSTCITNLVRIIA